jgi:hypothetical protein
LPLAALVLAAAGPGCIAGGADPAPDVAAVKALPAGDGSVARLIRLLREEEDDGRGWLIWHELRTRTGECFAGPRTAAARRQAADCWAEWLEKRHGTRP